jgi:triacylglycerol lipase|tara:strand:+ start:119 stop:865 length:747 start_codon:yes stop_codon:yes gene_type:complete
MNVSKLNFKDRSLLFAKLSKIAYNNIKKATSQAKKLGFSTVEFYDKKGAQAYRFMNKTDLIIACRGTEPTQWNDISADLKAIPVMAETVSRVHKGFKEEVDELWPMVCEDIDRKVNLKKNLWFCGHSLGAAMATIMASRAKHNDNLNDPIELYTYGSPRVGWSKYCKSLNVEHHRWRNNNDIVTKVPLWIMGYRHHGNLHYITSDCKIGKPGFKDWCKGMWAGIKAKKFDSIGDHDIQAYHDQIEKAL